MVTNFFLGLFYIQHHTSLLICGFENFRDEEMIETGRDILQFILLLTTPVQFLYSGTSENRALRSSFHGKVLWFRMLFLIRSINVPGYPSATSRTTSSLLSYVAPPERTDLTFLLIGLICAVISPFYNTDREMFSDMFYD